MLRRGCEAPRGIYLETRHGTFSPGVPHVLAVAFLEPALGPAFRWMSLA